MEAHAYSFGEIFVTPSQQKFCIKFLEPLLLTLKLKTVIITDKYPPD